MNNDLISREALKKVLHNFFDGKIIDEPAYILRDVFCYIDNAPTVEPTFGLFKEMLCTECEKRPQGECQNCDFKKFSERMIDVIIDNADGIIEELERRVRGEKV